MSGRRRGGGLVAFLLIIAIIGGGVFLFINNTEVRDFVIAKTVSLDNEVIEIEERLKLTDKGSVIFRASQPKLQEREDFNMSCNSYNSQISVLGCYTGGKIYGFRITAEELEGVEESTMAHELLHAVWRRMSSSEKEEISKYLDQVYRENQDLLAGELDIYEEVDQTDELHSRIGTQVKELPMELEEHYRRYFNDQDLVVEFYTKYSKPFKESRAKIESLKTEMEEISGRIDSLTAEYTKGTSEFTGQVKEFNTCAETVNCFKSNAEFQGKRAELVARQNELLGIYDEIDRLTKDYNAKVAEYNQNVLRTRTLENEINSNSKIEAI